MPSRLRIARSIGIREEEVAEDLVRQVKNRGVQDEQGRIPPFASDGLSHYRKALLEIYGEVPPYKGHIWSVEEVLAWAHPNCINS